MTADASQRSVGVSGQYSVARILGIWAASTLPMAVLSWSAFPLMAPDFEDDPLGSSVTRAVFLAFLVLA